MRIILFLMTSILFSQDQNLLETVSIQEAINIGLENNRSIVNANREVQKAYKEKWITISTGLPQISGVIDYQNFIELPVSLIPAQFFGGKEGEFAEVSFGTEQNLKAGVTLKQLLFDGSYMVGIQATKVYLDASKNVLEKTILEVKKNIVSTYASVLLTRENIILLKKNQANLKSNLSEITELLRNGFEEEESVEQIRLTLSGVNTQLRYSENLERITLGMLKLLLGYPEKELLLLSDSLNSLTNDVLFLMKTNENENIDNNIDVKISRNNVASDKLLYKYEISKSLPKLSAFISGNYTGNNNEFSFLEKDQKWFGSSIFGLSLELPIFSSFGRSARSQKAQITLEQSRTDLEETKARISLEIKSAINEYDLSIELYFTSKENLALSESIEKKNQLKYFEGITTSFELRQAQLQLYNSQNNYLKSIQNVIIKKLNLETLLNIPKK
jgi:outer membrane protein TolC